MRTTSTAPSYYLLLNVAKVLKTKAHEKHKHGKKHKYKTSVCTCNKGSGDDSAGVETPGSLEFNSVLCGLSQPFQSYPRVLGIQDKLLHGTLN